MNGLPRRTHIHVSLSEAQSATYDDEMELFSKLQYVDLKDVKVN
jgi:hypothetical protein